MGFSDREGARIQQLWDGDEHAWRAVVSSTMPSIYKYVYLRLGGRKADTEDLVQEVYLRAVRHIHSYRPRAGSLRMWLFGIARNEVRRNFGHRRRHASEGSLAELLGQSEIADKRPLVSELLQSLELRGLVHDVLLTLPERQQTLLLMRYNHELSVKEIASQLCLSEKAAESRLIRAHRAFRRCLRRALKEVR